MATLQQLILDIVDLTLQTEILRYGSYINTVDDLTVGIGNYFSLGHSEKLIVREDIQNLIDESSNELKTLFEGIKSKLEEIPDA